MAPIQLSAHFPLNASSGRITLNPGRNSQSGLLPVWPQRDFCSGTTDFSLAKAKFIDVHYQVSPNYFRTVGTPLLLGRAFTPDDNAASPKVAVVNQAFAKRLFGIENAVGTRFPTAPGKEVEIVGVVADGKYSAMTEDSAPAVFFPILQSPNSDIVLLIHSHRPSAQLAPEIRQAIASVDPGLPVFSLNSWNDMLGVVLFPRVRQRSLSDRSACLP